MKNSLIAVLLSATLILSAVGCADGQPVPDQMISGVGEIEFSADTSDPDGLEAEFPPAGESSSQQESSASESTASTPESSSASPSSSSASLSSSASSESSQSEQSSSSESQPQEDDDEIDSSDSSMNRIPVAGEMSAVWISYLDLGPMLTGKTASQFTNNIGNAFDKVVDTGLNTVIVQVRPFADALYESDYFPWSYLCTGTEGKDPGYDPLEIMVREAHERGLSIEAWLNPYRVRASGSSKALSSDNQASIWLGEGNDSVIRYDGGIYYNPASSEAQELIINGVEEIVRNYAVDGIHFDDYFYPNPDSSFDDQTYAQYSGNMSLGDWRRANVSDLVEDVYDAVNNIDSSVQFGISPAGNNQNNYNQQYADVGLWVSSGGYIDYICPQVYWGFNHSTMPFAQTTEDWNDMITHSSVELIVGIGAYRMGESGEWYGSSDILSRMVQHSRDQSEYGGFILYRYDSLYNSSVPGQASNELANLSDIL